MAEAIRHVSPPCLPLIPHVGNHFIRATNKLSDLILPVAVLEPSPFLVPTSTAQILRQPRRILRQVTQIPPTTRNQAAAHRGNHPRNGRQALDKASHPNCNLIFFSPCFIVSFGNRWVPSYVTMSIISRVEGFTDRISPKDRMEPMEGCH